MIEEAGVSDGSGRGGVHAEENELAALGAAASREADQGVDPGTGEGRDLREVHGDATLCQVAEVGERPFEKVCLSFTDDWKVKGDDGRLAYVGDRNDGLRWRVFRPLQCEHNGFRYEREDGGDAVPRWNRHRMLDLARLALGALAKKYPK